MTTDIQRVGVIGSGTMGSGIAQVFAQRGFAVLVHDVSRAALDRARGSIEGSLTKFVEKGRLAAADRDATLGRLTFVDATERLADVDLAIEAIVENESVKKELFGE